MNDYWLIQFAYFVLYFCIFSEAFFQKNTKIYYVICFLLFIIYSIYFCGFRDIYSFSPIDTQQYISIYKNIDTIILDEKERLERGFLYTVFLLKKINVSAQVYILLLHCLFLCPLLYFVHKISKKQKSALILISFASFGTYYSLSNNVIRSGIAFSFVLLSILFLFEKKYLYSIISICIAYYFHSTALLYCIAIIFAYFFESTIVYLFLWILAVYFSWKLQGFLTTFLHFVKFHDIVEDIENKSNLLDFFYKTGFRLDFTIFSFIFISIGISYIYFLEFKDKFYIFIINIFLILNIIFVMAYEIPFSDRYGLLSWSLAPLIVAYPLVTMKAQYILIYKIITLLFLFCLMYFFTYPNIKLLF